MDIVGVEEDAMGVVVRLRDKQGVKCDLVISSDGE